MRWLLQGTSVTTLTNQTGPLFRGGRFFRLAQKELRETLRDRRTIITLVAMPLIVYPLLSLIFKTFLLSNLGIGGASGEIRYRYLVLSDHLHAATTPDQLALIFSNIGDLWEAKEKSRDRDSANGGTNSTPTAQNGREAVKSQRSGPKAAKMGEHYWDFAPTGIVNPEYEFLQKSYDSIIEVKVLGENSNQRLEFEIFSSDQDPPSLAAARFFKERLQHFNMVILQQRLASVGNDPRLLMTPIDRKVEMEESGNQFTAMIPLILVLMTITGAVYPAIDLTAGERERGTLETLIAAPVPRIRVLLAKMLAVITVAVMTASLNVIGMVVTLWAFQLEKVVLGDAGLTWLMGLKVFLLLALLATFFAAVLLVVTSFARSFKEAQAYLIPLILMSMAPGLLAMTPGLKLEGPLAVCPMINLLLLARDVLENNVSVIPAAVAIFSTVVYGGLAIAAAASIFGADSILYGSQSSWKELFAAPVRRSAIAPLNVTLVCLLLLLPINFIAIAFLGRLVGADGAGISVTVQLLLMSLFTMLAFWVFPTFVASWRRVDLRTGFGWLRTKTWMYPLAIVMGLGLWPIVMTLINGWYELVGMLYSSEAAAEWHARLTQFSSEQAEKFRQTSPFVIAFAMSIVPAITEEWFFRGMLQRTLLRSTKPWRAIFVSALLFGVFHTLSGSVVAFDRLLPTAMMGVILGYMAYKANSILPGILLHAFHNAAIAFIAYYLPQLNEVSWFPKNAETIPPSWLVVSAAIAAIGFFILAKTKAVPLLGHQESTDEFSP
jgi:sodium transport system permease protein